MISRETHNRMGKWADRRAEELIFDRTALEFWRTLPLAGRLDGIATYAHLAGRFEVEDKARSMLADIKS